MITAAWDVYPKLLAYLIVAYVAAAAGMSRFAGNLEEVFAFGVWIWAIPAIVAIRCRKGATLLDRFGYSALSLVTIIALVWLASLTFQMTY